MENLETPVDAFEAALATTPVQADEQTSEALIPAVDAIEETHSVETEAVSTSDSDEEDDEDEDDDGDNDSGYEGGCACAYGGT